MELSQADIQLNLAMSFRRFGPQKENKIATVESEIGKTVA